MGQRKKWLILLWKVIDSQFPNGWRSHRTRSMAPSKNLLILFSSAAADVIIYIFKKSEIWFLTYLPLLGMFWRLLQSSVQN